MFAFLYVKTNSMEICEEISFPSFFRKMLISAFWLRYKANYLETMRGYPIFLVDSNSLCKDLLFPHCPNMAQKPLYLVGYNSHDGACPLDLLQGLVAGTSPFVCADLYGYTVQNTEFIWLWLFT